MKFAEFDPKRHPKKKESPKKVYPAVPAQPALFVKKQVEDEDEDEAIEKNIIIKVN